MVLIAKETFVQVNDKLWFVYFDKGKSYEVSSRSFYYFMINGCQFSVDKLTDYDQVYVYNFFYTEREYRKLKLDKLNKI